MVDLAVHSIDRETKEEIVETVTSDFPYRGDIADMNAMPKRVYPWHWHNDVEFFFMQQGAIEYCVPGATVQFGEGEAGFVNAGVMHQTRALCVPCLQEEHIFLPSFLTGGASSRIDSLYIFPLTSASGLSIVKFDAGSEECGKAVQLMKSALSLADEKKFGYEAEIRSLMTSLWLLALKFCRAHNLMEKKESIDTKRIGQMARFIDLNFAQHLTVSHIAEAANIGERECCRCFSRQLGTSPLDYLLDVRVGKAREFLSTSDDSVELIGERCGFSSGGYFSKVFKKRTGLSPREFRKSHIDNNL